MYGNFMTTHVLFDENIGVFDDTRTYGEESGSDIFLLKKIEQFPKDVTSQCISICI